MIFLGTNLTVLLGIFKEIMNGQGKDLLQGLEAKTKAVLLEIEEILNRV